MLGKVLVVPIAVSLASWSCGPASETTAASEEAEYEAGDLALELAARRVISQTVEIDGLEVFYRQAGSRTKGLTAAVVSWGAR